MDLEFRTLLRDNNYCQSMTRVDNHYDNAFSESLSPVQSRIIAKSKLSQPDLGAEYDL